MYKFAIVGCGTVSKIHAENIQKVGKLVAICDIEKEKANALAHEYYCTAHYTIDDLLKSDESIDVIVVCTPTGLHAEHCIKSLQASKHVLCESSLCLTSAAAWQIVETEKFCGKKLFAVQTNRQNAILQELKKLLESGALGKLYSFEMSCAIHQPDEYYSNWRGKLFPGGGSLCTEFNNYIDTLTWLFGSIETVHGTAKNTAHQNVIEFEDTGAAALQMRNSLLGSFYWSLNVYKDNEVTLTVRAEKGKIKIGGEDLNEVKYCRVEDGISLSEQFLKDKKKPLLNDNYNKVYEALVNVLNKDEKSNAYDGLRTVETIEKIYKAISNTRTT